MLFAKVCHRLACLKLESWIMTWNQRWRQALWNQRCFSLLSYLFESHVIAVILVFNILFWQDGTALAWRYEVKPKMKVNAFMLQKPNASTNMENMKSSSICSVFFEECKKIPKTKYCKQLWEVGAWHVKKTSCQKSCPLKVMITDHVPAALQPTKPKLCLTCQLTIEGNSAFKVSWTKLLLPCQILILISNQSTLRLKNLIPNLVFIMTIRYYVEVEL